MSTKIAVLVSGGGTNLQALIDAQSRGELGGGSLVAMHGLLIETASLVSEHRL